MGREGVFEVIDHGRPRREFQIQVRALLRREFCKPPVEDRFRGADELDDRSEEHTSELQSLMRISYAVFCLKKKNSKTYNLVQLYLPSTIKMNIINTTHKYVSSIIKTKHIKTKSKQ